MLRLTPPVPITAEHNREIFYSGVPSLDEGLKKRTLKNHASGALRCFIVCAGKEVVDYYSLSAGAISHDAGPKTMRRNMPNPLPVLLLARLVVDQHYHNQGLGQGLLRDALLRVVSVSGDAGVFAILVHALSEQAKRFYLSRDFVE